MADKSENDGRSETKSEPPELRNQLLRRLAVAAGLVAVLIGMLAVFDHLSQPSEEQEVRVFTEPVPVAPKKMVTQPVTPMEAVADQATLAQEEKTEPALATEPPPPPEVAAQPVPPVPARVEVPPRSKLPRPAAPVAEGVPDMTAPPPIVPPATTPPVAVAQPSPSARILETSTPAAPPRLFSGFVLQAGVFSSAQRAEELHARLTLSGVQSSIETRVQVGPFRTRKEAAEAQAKLRELGIDSILIAPKGGR